MNFEALKMGDCVKMALILKQFMQYSCKKPKNKNKTAPAMCI